MTLEELRLLRVVQGILVRNYVWKRRTEQSRELQVEIDMLKKQVASLELRGNPGLEGRGESPQ